MCQNILWDAGCLSTVAHAEDCLPLASAVYPDTFSMNSTQEDTSKSLTAYKNLQHSQSQGWNYNKQKIQLAQKLTNTTLAYIHLGKHEKLWRNARTDTKHCDTTYLREMGNYTLFSF